MESLYPVDNSEEFSLNFGVVSLGRGECFAGKVDWVYILDQGCTQSFRRRIDFQRGELGWIEVLEPGTPCRL